MTTQTPILPGSQPGATAKGRGDEPMSAYTEPFYGDYHEYDVDLPPKRTVTPAEEADCYLGVRECARHRWERKRDHGADAPDHPDVHYAGAAGAAPCGSGERWRTLNAADVTCAACLRMACTERADTEG